MAREMKVARIYISEGDRGRQQTLLEEILALLHDQHRVHGVTVYRGIEGFGGRGQIHAADLLRLTLHLPLVIEFFDEPQAVDQALATLSGLVPSGHIISWPVTVT